MSTVHLSLPDWLVIVSYLIFSVYIGLRYRKQAGKSIADFFLGGRNLPWYIAGLSMVATTFAADTPLLVTEIVSQNGISSNWLWWNMLIGGMLTTFFFAHLWRRAEVITELEFIELRYEGKPAAFLRGFKAVYLGVLLNSLVIGWVNYALMKIIHVFFDVPQEDLLWYIALAMLITAGYSALSGLLGVAMTDAFQFIIAMGGCIVLAIIVVGQEQIGGIEGLKTKLPESALNFFPTVGTNGSSDSFTTLSISVITFFSYIGLQWWASWYPGAEPGGGGYVAQRIMGTKNERHAFYATLFFQMAHYCLRPWPWIIVALCTIVLYPELPADEKAQGYVMAMKQFLPDGLRGLLLVAFLAAYMSTISTQLNWGASFLVNDIYRRFIRPENSFPDDNSAQKSYVGAGRIATLLIMLISLFITSQIITIESAWKFILGSSAGIGMVLILRWYWWRINAWSEITALIAPFAAYSFSSFYLEKSLGEYYSSNNGTFFFTALVTTLSWLTVTFFTSKNVSEKLKLFYSKVKPGGWWEPVEKALNVPPQKLPVVRLAICWLSAIAMTYSLLFFTGKFILHEWADAAVWSIAFIVSIIILRIAGKKVLA